MEPLTARQTQILDFVRHEQDRRGVGPSLQEIQARFGFRSATAAVHHLEALERKGALRRLAGKARAIVLAGERPAFERIPVYGRIPAGYGDAAEPVAEGAVAVDLSTLGVERGSLAKNPRLFALRVRGDSMTGA
ncbi:MAG: repressor LexA, partial [Verrucomicrobiae bacterium]|nr:repressor LexA [Verrucomicrobiae bacterium]